RARAAGSEPRAGDLTFGFCLLAIAAGWVKKAREPSHRPWNGQRNHQMWSASASRWLGETSFESHYPVWRHPDRSIARLRTAKPRDRVPAPGDPPPPAAPPPGRAGSGRDDATR